MLTVEFKFTIGAAMRANGVAVLLVAIYLFNFGDIPFKELGVRTLIGAILLFAGNYASRQVRDAVLSEDRILYRSDLMSNCCKDLLFGCLMATLMFAFSIMWNTAVQTSVTWGMTVVGMICIWMYSKWRATHDPYEPQKWFKVF